MLQLEWRAQEILLPICANYTFTAGNSGLFACYVFWLLRAMRFDSLWEQCEILIMQVVIWNFGQL